MTRYIGTEFEPVWMSTWACMPGVMGRPPFTWDLLVLDTLCGVRERRDTVEITHYDFGMTFCGS